MESVSDKTGKGRDVIPFAYIQEMSTAGVGKKHYLCRHKSLIGRNVKADIPISSCNVSRNHAFLEWNKDKGWFITDNKSVNGVYLKNCKLKPAVPYPIKNGQKIFLGPPEMAEYWLEFHADPHKKPDCYSEIKMESQSKIPAKIGRENLGYVGSSSNSRESSARQTRSCQKRALRTDSPKCSQKKYCSDAPDSESLSLEERLAAVDSLIKMNEALDKRVKQILNQSDETLNGSQETPTQESTSLLRVESQVTSSMLSADPPAADSEWFEATQKSKMDNSQKPSDIDEVNKTSTQTKFSEKELHELKEKVAALEKELQERESALQKQLKEKELLLEEQEQQKKDVEKEKLKSNIKEAGSLQKAVCTEVANQFGELMESELTCSICTELFIKATTLDCGHSFCSECITTWRRTKKVCPICRTSISGMSKSIVIDNFIEKMVEKLSPEDQEKRKQIIGERTATKRKTTKKKKTTRATTTRRRNTRQVRSENRNPVIPENMIADSISWGPSISLSAVFSPISDDVVEVNFESPFFDESDDSSVEGDGYYGGYGRCYNCGRRGHWANGCPD